MNVCPIHQSEILAGVCIRCGKSLCPDCVKSFGYYCSIECCEIKKRESPPILSESERENLRQMDRRSNHIAFWLVRVFPALIILWTAVHFTVRSLDPSGKTQWKIALEEEPIQIKSLQGVVYVLSGSGTLQAVSMKNGNMLWKKNAFSSGSVLSFLEIRNQKIYAATEKEILALDLRQGTLVSKYECSGWLAAGPVIENDSLYFLYRDSQKDPWNYLNSEEAQEYSLVKLPLAQMIPEWIESIACLNPSKIISSPEVLLIDDGRDDENRIILAIDPKTGRKKWEAPHKKSAFASPDPLLTPHHVILLEKGEILGFDFSGVKKWQRSVAQAVIQWGLTPQEDILIVAGQKMMCFGSQDGSKMWEQFIGNSDGYFAVSPRMIYVAGSYVAPKSHVPNDQWMHFLKPIGFPDIEIPKDYVGHRLFAINSGTGKILWQKDHVIGIPLFELGRLYFYNVKFSMNLLDAGKLIGEVSQLEKTKGRADIQWRFNWEGSSRLVEFSREGIILINVEINFGPGDLMSGGPKEPSKCSLISIHP